MAVRSLTFAVFMMSLCFFAIEAKTQKVKSTTAKASKPDQAPTTNLPKVIRIAWLAPAKQCGHYKADSSVNVLKFAASVAKTMLLSDTDIQIKWYDSKCSPQGGKAAALTARSDLDPDLILGPPCSEAMKEVAALASEWNIPVFTWGANDQSLEDRGKYSTLVRVFPPLNTFSSTVYFLSTVFNWKRYSIISDTRSQYRYLSAALQEQILRSNFTLASQHTINPNMTDSEIKIILTEIQSSSRIVMLSVPWVDMRRYVLLAQELNMTFGDYAFLCFNSDTALEDDLSAFSKFTWRRNDSRDDLAKAAFESVIHIITDISNNNFSFTRLKQYLNESGEFVPYASPDLPAAGEPDFDVSAAYLYDAMMLWAHFANIMINEGEDIRNGSRMLDMVRYVEIIGLTGRVSMNWAADRLANVWMLDMDLKGDFHDFLHIQNRGDGSATLTRPFFECPTAPGIFQNTCSYDVLWPSGLSGPDNAPFDTPMCGFNNEHCLQ